MATAWDVGNGAGSLISMSLYTDQKKGRQLEFGKVLKIPRKSFPWTLFCLIMLQ